ncbi:GMC oxidoreductase [Rubrivivax sp. JA1026]|uniref:GMC oxidoreductase n=1 Tax=Rubrivivax sp. JA1026 TaxID=2710888 RepID=UPI0013E8FA3C|nr:GMC family oxidoreductase [Rubrivivax sp. JA1026]
MTTDTAPEGLDRLWDTIVVGTGIGGATIGHALARAGQQVLFCELGDRGDDALLGEYPELAAGRDGRALGPGDAALAARGGRCADRIVDRSARREREFTPFIGHGPGGSSALYGMAMERFTPEDFEPGRFAAGAVDAAVVERWPVSHAELLPFYEQAETLYGVRGDADPLAAHAPRLPAPAPLSAAGSEFADFLRARGLHPYRLPSACEYRPGCGSCQSFLCRHGCKRDAESACLVPAVRDHGATLLAGCRVLELLADGRRAGGLRCTWRGRPLTLRGRRVILAAGALQSPLILLRSAGGAGLGNGSGLLGRCLMRHLIDVYLVRPRAADEPFDNRRKELACNDFYVDGGAKLGTLQSFGRLPPAPMLLGSLASDLRATPWAAAAGLLELARPLMLPLLRDLSEGWMTLATIAEDLPYADNRVACHPDGPQRVLLEYRLRPEAHERMRTLRAHLRRTLQGRRWRRLDQVANNQRIAHVCGTCRFGDDPRHSVLDRDNRVHELDNVYVVDSSFFPSSGGTNPSLTIAANALRVAGRLLATGG